MNPENYIVRCSHCNAKNRIPGSRIADRPVCGRCKTPLPTQALYPEHAINASDSTFGPEVLGFPGAVVVYFWSPSCGHCRRLTPLMDGLAAEYAGRVKFVKMIPEQNPVTASQHQIQGVPAIAYYRAGRKVDQTVGALPIQEIERRIRQLL